MPISNSISLQPENTIAQVVFILVILLTEFWAAYPTLQLLQIILNYLICEKKTFKKSNGFKRKGEKGTQTEDKIFLYSQRTKILVSGSLKNKWALFI